MSEVEQAWMPDSYKANCPVCDRPQCDKGEDCKAHAVDWRLRAAGAEWEVERLKLILAGVKATVPEGQHLWMQRPEKDNWPWCLVCGLVKRRDGKNKPCKGPTRIALRDAGSSGSGPE